MVEAIVSATTELLRDLLIEEATFLLGVRNNVQGIRAELQAMQCFLKDADKKQYKDERVRNWVRSVRNLAYKSEDIIETYAVKVESRKGKGMKRALKRFACIFDEGVNLHKLGLDIEDIKTQLENLTKRLQTYDIKLETTEGESSNAANKDLLRQTFPDDIKEDFVGMQSDLDRLVSFMIDGDKSNRIISIYGMGGSGKTTLAKRVFNHNEVQKCFESFAWVTLSQKFKAEKILQEILEQLDSKKNGDKMEYRKLVQELCQAQREKKCLVVLDDIWKIEDWTILSRVFPEDAANCRVLLTSRKKAVAEVGVSHKINLLNEEEGWQLLKKKALVTTEDGGHEEIGKEMVHKCGYLPLAISVIGGILSRKGALEEWKTVSKDIDSYLRCGDGIEENQQVMQILDLSYDDLPYQLKPCLLYLASYPEDTNIDIQKLCWKWVAEGMVLSKDQRRDETLTDVAERYLRELANRSLVQVQTKETHRFYNPIINQGDISCSLHDLMRDLCLKKCQQEEFLNLMDFRGNKQSISSIEPLVCNVYRLVIYGADDDTADAKILQAAKENARMYWQVGGCISAKEVSMTLGSLQFLRAVELENVHFRDTELLNKAIKKLIHVRFMSFVNCWMDVVPSSIAKLPYLQTFYLILDGGHAKVPNIFWKLKSLVHLVLAFGLVFERKLRLDSLNGLETLVHDRYGIEIESLSRLTNLRTFSSSVSDNESMSLIINHIEHNWCNIREVRLMIGRGCDFTNAAEGSTLLYKLFTCPPVQSLDIGNVHIRELPVYESSLLASSHLVYLCLNRCHIEKDPMPTLEKLPRLKTLKLRSFVGEELICSSIGFPNLITLVLGQAPNMKKWIIEESAMLNLSTLSIIDCPKLEMIPDGVKFLKEMRKLEIHNMPKEFSDRICVINGEEGADFDKVRHVSVISITSRGQKRGKRPN